MVVPICGSGFVAQNARKNIGGIHRMTEKAAGKISAVSGNMRLGRK